MSPPQNCEFLESGMKSDPSLCPQGPAQVDTPRIGDPIQVMLSSIPSNTG